MLVRSKLLLSASVALTFAVLGIMAQSSRSQPPAEPVTEVHPPAGQTYVGTKACSACHFKEFMTWKKTKHATEAFQKLPAKYQTDASCLICHSTGFGQPTGFKDIASTENLAGTTCEACHGPGSAHVATAKPFTNVKVLSPEQQAQVRGTIYKVQPGNVCMRCHTEPAHKPHPAYDKQ
jgi:hypothetical protein